jgi:hypothetical protein
MHQRYQSSDIQAEVLLVLHLVQPPRRDWKRGRKVAWLCTRTRDMGKGAHSKVVVEIKILLTSSASYGGPPFLGYTTVGDNTSG